MAAWVSPGGQRPISLTLNSCSRKLNRRSSHDSSNAVKIGSFDDKAIKLGLANARYALMRERECRNESSERDWTHSSQPHLNSAKKNFGLFVRHLVCFLLTGVFFSSVQDKQIEMVDNRNKRFNNHAQWNSIKVFPLNALHTHSFKHWPFFILSLNFL